MYVIFDSADKLYKYPECMGTDYPNSLVQDYYFIRSTIDINNPVKDQMYIDGSNVMPFNRVLECVNAFDHGGLIYLKLTYSVNGKSYVHDRSYYVYTK